MSRSQTTLLDRIAQAHTDLSPTVATWWIGETGSWRDAPGRGAPPHKVSRGWGEFRGVLEECAQASLPRKGDGPNFCLAEMDRGYRGAVHVQTVHGLTVDVDDPHTDLDALRAWLERTGLAYVAQVRGGKVHVHIPIDPISGRDRFMGAARVFLGELAGLFPGVDLSMARPEQMCFAYARVGGSPVATFSGDGYALDLSGWVTPGALGTDHDRLPGRDYLLAAAAAWSPGIGGIDARTVRQCHEPHRTILLTCLEGDPPDLEEGGRNAALHAALWSLARVDPELSPGEVARALVLGGVKLDRDAEFASAEWWARQYETAAREIGIYRAAKLAEDSEKGGSWVGLVQRDKAGEVTGAPANAAYILAHDPDIADALAWNAFTDRPEVLPGRALPWGEQGPRQVVLDAEWYRALEWLRSVPRCGASFGKSAVLDGLSASARLRSYDPLERYLRGLRWDGVPRIATWLRDWLGAEDTELVAQMGRRWLIAGAARGLSPGCQVDSALVLQGKQGLGKSSAFRILAGDWYSDRLGDPQQKDAMQEIQGLWVIEIAELESMRRHDLATLKAFLTRPVDVYRASHGHSSYARPRRCVFGASTNTDQFLTDPTGARRWWCVRVTKDLDQAGFAAVRDQLWAEAVVEYDRGTPWHLTGWLAAQAEDAAESHREDSPWEDAIEKWAPEDGFSTGDVFAALGVSRTDTRSWYQIRDSLRALGYVQQRRRGDDKQRRWYKSMS